MKKVFLSILSITLIWISCDKEDDIDPDVCANTAYTYNTDIKPILDASCAFAGCHDAASQQAGINLTTYSSVTAAGTSNIVRAINHESGVTPMPYMLPKLPEATIQKIECWVSKGAIQ